MLILFFYLRFALYFILIFMDQRGNVEATERARRLFGLRGQGGGGCGGDGGGLVAGGELSRVTAGKSQTLEY